jgi:hypothetical protein
MSRVMACMARTTPNEFGPHQTMGSPASDAQVAKNVGQPRRLLIQLVKGPREQRAIWSIVDERELLGYASSVYVEGRDGRRIKD